MSSLRLALKLSMEVPEAAKPAEAVAKAQPAKRKRSSSEGVSKQAHAHSEDDSDGGELGAIRTHRALLLPADVS